MKTIRLIPLFLIIFLISGWNNAYSRDELSKVIRKEYPVKPDAQLVVENKFGDVRCINWDKNIISIEVKITVSASNEKDASKILENISVDFTGNESQVQAHTVFKDKNISGRIKFKVDYTVNMPYTNALDLSNKFGNIYINEVGGKSKITVGYGNVEINKLNNSDNLLDIKYGKGSIQSMKGAVVFIKYSDLDVQYAGALWIDSKYSNLTAAKIISLNANLSGGKLDMGNSSVVDGTAKFSDLDIKKIEKDLTLDIQYGNFTVNEMPADFGNININNKFGNISIGISKNASYSLDASLKFCDLNMSESNAHFSEKIIKNTSKSYKAVVGNASPSSKVTIRSEYGDVDLK
ncbi:MAG: hypothetical protein Q8867_01200 [Bacteroidota bacterium]|nr:hypothetical protein [Bacteroidota bacterium]